MTSALSGTAAGRMDRRVTFQRQAPGVDEMNEPNGAWGDLFTRWAEVLPDRGAERYANAQNVPVIPTVFRVRFDSATETIGLTDRILYDGKTFDLKDRIELGRRQRIEFRGIAA